MLKKLGMFIPVILLFVTSSCVTTSVWDETLGPDETAEVNINSNIYVSSYNGIPVDWCGGWMRSAKVTIPSGYTEFLCNWSIAAGTVTYYGNDLRFTYRFLPGNRYRLAAVSKFFKGIGFSIYNLTTGEEEFYALK
ncbi:MAG: hypothetical protein LBP76_10410 [Treponema sp.]|jgi:hypothetical protein|nr:hypothetical protein [Treponema sp.]